MNEPIITPWMIYVSSVCGYFRMLFAILWFLSALAAVCMFGDYNEAYFHHAFNSPNGVDRTLAKELMLKRIKRLIVCALVFAVITCLIPEERTVREALTAYSYQTNNIYKGENR